MSPGDEGGTLRRGWGRWDGCVMIDDRDCEHWLMRCGV